MFFIHYMQGTRVPVTEGFSFAPTVGQTRGEVGVKSDFSGIPLVPSGTAISLSAVDASVEYQIVSEFGELVQDWTRAPGTISPGQVVRMRGNVPMTHGGHVIGTLTIGAYTATWILKARYDVFKVTYQYVDDPWTQNTWIDRMAFLKDLGFTRVIAQINFGGLRQYPISAYEIPLYLVSSQHNTERFINACRVVGLEPCVGKMTTQLTYLSSTTFRTNMLAQNRCGASAVWYNNQWNLVATITGGDYGMGGYQLPVMLSAHDPRNVEMIAGTCREIAEFGPDEVVIDYIRHNGARMDTSLTQMARFNAFAGTNFTFTPAGNRNQWPEVVLPHYINPHSEVDGTMYETFKVWQANKMTDMVNAIRAAMPVSVDLGAATFGDSDMKTGTEVEWYLHAQDWTRWQNEGTLRSSYPMLYEQTVADYEAHLENTEMMSQRAAGKIIIPLIKNDYSVGWPYPGTPEQHLIKATQVDMTINQYGYPGIGLWQAKEHGQDLPSSTAVNVCDNLVPNYSSYCIGGFYPPF